MKRMTRLLCIALIVLPWSASAERNVLDLGGTPLGWTAPVTGQWSVPRSRSAKIDVTPLIKAPVSTTRMRPGQVYSQRLFQLQNHRPFFILGSDPASLRWLHARKEYLLQINAVGLIVSVPSAEQLTQLRARLAPLESQLISGDELALQLNLDRYPVLIHRGEARQ